MPAHTLMIQGTASGVGKSLIVTGLCRLFARQGIACAPFKAQNMSLNATVTPDGREIGLAQAIQAEASGLEPDVDMNPILLKPRAHGISQIILEGRPRGELHAERYWEEDRDAAWKVVTDALRRLRDRFDLVVIEGSGSPAEMNLRERDLANMRVAEAADAPVLLVGDIERGGVFASLLGTLHLLPEDERARVKALIVNRFHGDRKLFREGVRYLEETSGLPVLGVIPYTPLDIPEEDALDETRFVRPEFGAASASGPAFPHDPAILAVVLHPHAANLADLDPFRHVRDVTLRWARRPEDLAGAAAIVLPGTRNAVDDLAAHRASGLADAIVSRSRNGTVVVGLCGGLQMLGEYLDDPDALEGALPSRVPGLGLLPIGTRFETLKRTSRIRGTVCAPDPFLGGLSVEGFEIHQGRMEPSPEVSPLVRLTERAGTDGEPGTDGVWQSSRLWGTYMHGIFDSEPFLEAFVSSLNTACEARTQKPRRSVGPCAGEASMSPWLSLSGQDPRSMRERRLEAYDHLADLLADSLDLRLLGAWAGIPGDRLCAP